MVNCSVVGCKSRTEQKYENITFHTFPLDESIRNSWVAATGRKHWQPTKYSRVCSKHFEDHCFRRTQQKVYVDKFSTPTLFVHNISLCDQTTEELQPSCSRVKTTDRNRLIDDDMDDNLDGTDVVVSKDHDYLADPSRLTEFTRSVVTYIAGFVVKGLLKQLKCTDCLSLLTATDKNMHTLQYKKDKGGLQYPSSSVVQLCELAEQAHRAHKVTNRKNHMHYLLQACLKKSLGLKLFSERNVCWHYALLIKAICKKYLNVRIHYYTKTTADKTDNIRNFYTKLILFKGQ